MQLLVPTHRATRVFVTSAALSLLLGGTAFAVDADAVAGRIKALYHEKGGEVTFNNVKAEGDDVILEGTKIKLAAASDNQTEIGDITLEKVEDTSDGGFIIGKVIIPDQDFTTDTGQDKDRVIVKGILMEKVQLPSASASDPLDKMVFYDRMAIDQIDVEVPGTSGVALKGIEVTLNAPQKPERVDYAWSIASIATTFTDTARNPLAPLNMDSFNASLRSNGAWQPQTGDTSLDNFEINAADLGKINITGSMGGYNLAFLQAVQKMQDEMLKADADSHATGLAALKLSQQLSLQRLTVRFDDESLTKKLLEYFAKKQDSDAETLAMQMQMLVPLLATQLKNPEFAKQLGAAASQYFSDPKSLTISASPDEPVSFAAIAATASADPTKLIQLLKLTVSANN